MELVLDQNEIIALVRESLSRRGVNIDHLDRVVVRQNHKLGTVRLVFMEGNTTCISDT